MSGLLCNGRTIKSADLKLSKAYCEGMEYRAGGTSAARPKTDNPNIAGSDGAISWDLGWDAAHASAGGTMTVAAQGCCSVNPSILA